MCFVHSFSFLTDPALKDDLMTTTFVFFLVLLNDF